MQLTLARWDDISGRSCGHWLVREIPGFRIVEGPGGWRVDCFPDLFASPRTGPFLVDVIRVWGGGWSPRRDLYDSLPGSVKGPHKTRSAALCALEMHLYPTLGSSLSAALEA